MSITDVSSGIENSIYDNRVQAQSSVSKYAQSNIIKNGSFTKESINGTPDDNIITPNLKKEKVETTSLTSQTSFLSSLLGSILPFTKTSSVKEINEVAPNKDATQYGKVIVKETKGGFVDLVDETPNNKRSMNLHPSGTYHQIINDGSKFEKIVNDNTLFVEGNNSTSITKDLISLIKGTFKQQIIGNSEVDINENNNLTVSGNSISNIKKDLILEINGNETINIDGNNTIQINGNQGITIGGNSSDVISGNENKTINGNSSITISGSLSICANSGITISCGASIINITPTAINILSPQVNINK